MIIASGKRKKGNSSPFLQVTTGDLNALINQTSIRLNSVSSLKDKIHSTQRRVHLLCWHISNYNTCFTWNAVKICFKDHNISEGKREDFYI